MYIEDLAEFEETVLTRFEKRFYLGLQRIQLCLYLLLGCFTVNRPSAILHLRYRDLKVSLQRDPDGGRHRIAIATTHRFTKKYLGMKQINTFVFPEIINDPSLMLSIHTYLLGILLDDDAFKAPNLKSMDDIQRLAIGKNRQKMDVPLKPSKLDHYVFYFGELLSYLEVMFMRRFRYGSGTRINKSGEFSEAEQNLIMNHANIGTFLRHYLTREVHQLDRVIRGLGRDSAIIQAMSRIGASIDRRRPRDIPPELKATISTDPEVQEAIQKLEAFKSRDLDDSRKNHDKLDQLKRRVVIDIKHQLSGKAMDEEKRETLGMELPPKLIDLLDKLITWPVSEDVEAEWKRRNAAVEAAHTYCSVREGGPQKGRPPKRAAPDPLPEVDVKRVKAEEPPRKSEAVRAREHIVSVASGAEEANRPRACFHCLKMYARPQEVTRHLRSDYLPYLPEQGPIKCPFCGIKLEHKQHLRAHVELMYRTLT
ncbi:uncharacterized protein GIQ15_01612 [Arthroderma uncinatum]|uniref:uncharacterized protein n=1 Tax=Arthroderma uncinatum TaxID=74035 RepID=UPI00144A566D|nr:uncharacterized protein GIQ15_01612 [Arthroderma uncinatum]KAF3492095.1 hypothetical protein GIQ15_01612 [Arthroderma uncinatum]